MYITTEIYEYYQACSAYILENISTFTAYNSLKNDKKYLYFLRKQKTKNCLKLFLSFIQVSQIVCKITIQLSRIFDILTLCNRWR